MLYLHVIPQMPMQTFMAVRLEEDFDKEFVLANGGQWDRAEQGIEEQRVSGEYLKRNDWRIFKLTNSIKGHAMLNE